MCNQFQKKLLNSMYHSFYMLQIIMVVFFICGIFLFQYSEKKNLCDKGFKTWNSVYNREMDFYNHVLDNRLDGIDASDILFYIYRQNGKIIDFLEVSVYYNAELLSETFQTEDVRRNYLMGYFLQDSKKVMTYYNQRKNVRVIKKKIAYENKIYSVLLFVDMSYLLSELYQYTGFLSDEFGNIFLSNFPLIDRLRVQKDMFLNEDADYQVQVQKIGDLTYAYLILYDGLDTWMYVIGVGGIMVFSLCILALIKIYLNRMVRTSTKSLNILLDEISAIQENQKSMLVVETYDEFQVVANQLNKLLQSIQELNTRNQELVLLENYREHKMLEAQFNPHFLYNTLEAIKYLIKISPEKSIYLIQQLVKILRYSIDEKIVHSYLEEDFSYILAFFSIYQTRFQYNFQYHIEMPDKMKKIPIPKLLLQPIIENSLKYVYAEKGFVSIEILGYEKEKSYVIQVSDNGDLLSEEKITEIEKILSQMNNETQHHGLYLTARRIKLFYGPYSSLLVKVQGKNIFEIEIAKEEIITHV